MIEDKGRIVKEQIAGGRRVEEGGRCPHSSRDGRAQVSHHWPVMCTGDRWGIRTSTGRDGMGGSDGDADTSNGLRQSARRKRTTKSHGDMPSLTENTQTRGDV